LVPERGIVCGDPLRVRAVMLCWLSRLLPPN
jgi:hypothetical protein